MRQDKYAVLVADLYVRQKESVCADLLELLRLKVDGLRVDNDRADRDSVLRNQGGIAALTHLMDEIIYGLPGSEKLIAK